MAFDWTQFICVGEELYRLSGESDPPCAEEALVRAAVGRLYYGSFKPVANAQVLDKEPATGSHERVFRSLERDGHAKLALQFRKFHKLRCEADYDAVLSTPDLGRWFSRARKFVTRIDELVAESGIL